MTEYRRAWLPEATWFFTANLVERHGNRCSSGEDCEYVTELCEKVTERAKVHFVFFAL